MIRIHDTVDSVDHADAELPYILDPTHGPSWSLGCPGSWLIMAVLLAQHNFGCALVQWCWSSCHLAAGASTPCGHLRSPVG